MRKLLLVILAVSALPAMADRLEWRIPTERENGAPLTVDEIGGYEIRYTLSGAEPESVIIPSGQATHYDLSGFDAGTYSFEIAVFDTDGLYSRFVSIEAVTLNSPPSSVPGFVFRAADRGDPVERCATLDRCRVEMLSARYGSE